MSSITFLLINGEQNNGWVFFIHPTQPNLEGQTHPKCELGDVHREVNHVELIMRVDLPPFFVMDMNNWMV